MNPFRWSGLLAFIVISALITVTGMFLLEPFVKNQLASYLSEKNGATVDIGDVRINYWPLQMTIRQIEIGDSQNLNLNAVQIERVNFQLSVDDLLLKKLIVDDMSVDNVQLETQRAYPARIIRTDVTKTEQKKTEEESQDDSFSISDIDLPDVKDVLKAEPLESTKVFESLQKDIESTQSNWRKIKQDIGDQQRWDEYDQRYAKIKQGFKGNTKEKLQALKEARQLIQDLKKEKVRIQQARRQFNEDYDRLNNEFKQARQAPSKDVQRIRQKYKLDNLNADNISQLLLGEKATAYIQLARRWYKKIQPYMETEDDVKDVQHERSRGRDIRFTEYNPQPDVLIKHVSISARLPRGDFKGEINNISSNQRINRKPMTFVLSGQKMRKRKAEEIKGEFNFIDPENKFVQVDYQLQAAQLDKLVLSRSSKLPLSINKGLLNMKMDARLADGRLKGQALMDFQQVVFSSGKQTGGMAAMLADSFRNIKQFNVDVRFVGALDTLQLKLKSDLDNQVGAQFKAQLKQKSREFEQQLQARINNKFKAPLAKLETQRQKLNQFKSDLDKKEQQIQQRIDALKQKIKQKENEKKQQLKNKLDSKKDKLKQKLLERLGR